MNNIVYRICREYNTNTKMIYYRASNLVTVISFVEENWSSLSEFFPKMKPGSLGSGNELSLANIITTDDMLGLSSGCSCTHKRLTWMQCNICDAVQESSKHVSISSNGLPSCHNFHA